MIIILPDGDYKNTLQSKIEKKTPIYPKKSLPKGNPQ